MRIGLFHWFWRHKVPWKTWGRSKSIRLVFFSILFRLDILNRWGSEFWIHSLITADISNLHELCIQIVFQIILLVGWEKPFHLRLSTVLRSVVPYDKYVILLFSYKLFDFRDLFSIGHNDTRVVVVLAQRIFKWGHILVRNKGNDRPYIVHMLKLEMGVLRLLIEEKSLLRLLIIYRIRQFLVITVIHHWNRRPLVLKSRCHSNTVLIVSDSFVLCIKFGDYLFEVTHLLDLSCNVRLVRLYELLLRGIILQDKCHLLVLFLQGDYFLYHPLVYYCNCDWVFSVSQVVLEIKSIRVVLDQNVVLVCYLLYFVLFAVLDYKDDQISIQSLLYFLYLVIA